MYNYIFKLTGKMQKNNLEIIYFFFIVLERILVFFSLRKHSCKLLFAYEKLNDDKLDKTVFSTCREHFC